MKNVGLAVVGFVLVVAAVVVALGIRDYLMAERLERILEETPPPKLEPIPTGEPLPPPPRLAPEPIPTFSPPALPELPPPPP